MCLAADYETTSGCVRKATVELFSRDLLDEFRQGVLTLLPGSATIPELPKYGTLDITKVLDSQYYFN
jgi:DNA-directed RNA polymerase